jgi:hypothetical protein
VAEPPRQRRIRYGVDRSQRSFRFADSLLVFPPAFTRAMQALLRDVRFPASLLAVASAFLVSSLNIVCRNREYYERDGERRAIHYGGNKSSSTVEHELRCSRHSQRSPASTLCNVMSNVVFQETSVPRRACSRRRFVHISHSRFGGLQHRSPSRLQLPGEKLVLQFCSSRWSHK